MGNAPRIVVTGASGFLGRRVVKLFRHQHHVIAIDRRTRDETSVSALANVEWHSVDIADADAIAATFERIKKEGGAKAILHLAAWYDFTGRDHLEYTRTNVEGTRILLERAETLGVERFVFASSVAACAFSTPGHPITETSPPEAEHVYGRSKRAGEALVRSWPKLPTAIVRFGALYSDWCEYPPLYVFLDTWLSRHWNRNILGGKGRTSAPYLHVRDAAECLLAVVAKGRDVEPAEVFLAAPDGAVSHHQLFAAATAYAERQARKPLLVPRSLAAIGMRARDLLGRLTGRRPFEQPWMAKYLDTELAVDATRTRARLGWAPHPRLDVLRRIPFLVENKRASPVEWMARNRDVMEPEVPVYYRIYRLLEKYFDEIEAAYQRTLGAGPASTRSAADEDERRWSSRVILRNLLHAVRTGQRASFMQFARDAALRRAQQGFPAEELVRSLHALDRICIDTLRDDVEGALLGPALREQISVAIDFGVDRVLEVYDDAAAGAWR